MDSKINDPEFKERKNRVLVVTEVNPLGFGNPESKLSFQKSVESQEFTNDLLDKSVELISSGECVVSVTEEDDGCIDGRHNTHVSTTDGIEYFVADFDEDGKPHERPKVAGGGYMTALFAMLAGGRGSDHVDDDLDTVIKKLAGQGVHCGIHTGGHQHDKATDCGGNDHFELIVNMLLAHRDEIAAQLELDSTNFGKSLDKPTYDRSMENLASLSAKNYFEDSSGASRWGIVADNLMELQRQHSEPDKPIAAIKHLSGDHMERFVVKNFVEGKTFSQKMFRDKLAAEYPDMDPGTLPQVFVIDAWRVDKLDHAVSNHDTGIPISMAYQEAAIATLTDGTLPTFVATC